MSAVLITGASRGLGLELVRAYHNRGWTIFPLVRHRTAARRLTDRYPERCHMILADVTSDSVESAIADILSKHTDRLDLLINNAGNIRKNRALAGAGEDDLRALFEVHCVGALKCVRAALPFLQKAERPAIVNITSRKGSIGLTTAAQTDPHLLIYAYQMAKAAQNMLTACLHAELSPRGIGVYAVHPGRLKTEVAPPDADTEPADAADKLAEWTQKLDHILPCHLYDLMNDTVLDW